MISLLSYRTIANLSYIILTILTNFFFFLNNNIFYLQSAFLIFHILTP